MSIKTIVAAMALQSGEDPVVGRAVKLAQHHAARLIVVHVIEGPAPDDMDLPTPIDQATIVSLLEKEARERLGELFEATATSAEVMIETGKPHDVIDTIARKNKADLVVIGAGVPRNLREKVFGSTADRVVRSSSCPVLVAKTRSLKPWQQIVAAVDLSKTSELAVDAAARLAPEVALNLAHIVEIPLGFEQAMLKAGTPPAEIDRYRKAKCQSARKEIQAAFPNIPAPSIRVTDGSADRELLRLGTRGRVDLLALGAQGRGAVSRLVLGSVARKVLQGATCDVLIVPPADA